MPKSAIHTTTLGVFSTRIAADRAIADLKRAGYRDDEIMLVTKNSSGKRVTQDGSGAQVTNAREGTAVGVATGLVCGALVGAGILYGVIPAIGPILAIGTLGTILFNAAGGAIIAGTAGALIGWCIPNADAKYYEEQVREGHHLVTVECGQRDDARDILMRHGGCERMTAPAV